MTYKEYLVWSEDVIENPMEKREYLKHKIKGLIDKAEHNKELLKALYNKSNLPYNVTHPVFYQYNNNYSLMYGEELKVDKKYHILFKVLENGHIDGIDCYPELYFNTRSYNVLYKGIEGITESVYNNRVPYGFRLNDTDLFLVSEVI
jgi:hypothetical protein